MRQPTFVLFLAASSKQPCSLHVFAFFFYFFYFQTQRVTWSAAEAFSTLLEQYADETLICRGYFQFEYWQAVGMRHIADARAYQKVKLSNTLWYTANNGVNYNVVYGHLDDRWKAWY